MTAEIDRLLTLYYFIADFIKDNGFSPSYRDMMKGADYSSLSIIKQDLEVLKERRQVDFSEGKARTVRVRTVRVRT